MNCDVVQRNLLGRERPDRPSADASAHLADCAACREWLQRLLQIERALPDLPVPPAEAARSALMRRILSQGAEQKPAPKAQPRPSIALVLGSWIMDPHASPRRRAAAGLVAGVAAALLLFVIGWLVWDGSPAGTAGVNPTARAVPDQLLADLGRRGIHTADGKKGSDRVKAMADAADELNERCTRAAQAGAHEDLIELAKLYSRVVDEGVVKTAQDLSAAERGQIPATIAENLGTAESQWKRLATSVDLPTAVKSACNKAALAASNGKKRLEELAA